MKPKRILPADVYDAMEFSALVYGGIGGGQYFERRDTVAVAPYCAIGHARELDHSVKSALLQVGIFTNINDRAVRQINRRRRSRGRWVRVPFEAWCEQLGVVRGESSAVAPPGAGSGANG